MSHPTPRYQYHHPAADSISTTGNTTITDSSITRIHHPAAANNIPMYSTPPSHPPPSNDIEKSHSKNNSEEKSNSTQSNVKEQGQEKINEVRNNVSQQVDSTRQYLHTAQEKANDVVKNIPNKSKELLDKSKNTLSNTIQRTQESIKQSAHDTKEDISDQVERTKDTSKNIYESLPSNTSEAKEQLNSGISKAQEHSQSILENSKNMASKAAENVKVSAIGAKESMEKASAAASDDIKYVTNKPTPTKTSTPIEKEVKREQRNDQKSGNSEDYTSSEKEHIAKHGQVSEATATSIADSGTPLEITKSAAMLASQPDNRQPLMKEDARPSDDERLLRQTAMRNVAAASLQQQHRGSGTGDEISINNTGGGSRSDSTVDAIPVIHESLLKHRDSATDTDNTNSSNDKKRSSSLSVSGTSVSYTRRLKQLLLFALTGTSSLAVTRVIMGFIAPHQKDISLFKSTVPVQIRLLMLAIMLPLYPLLLTMYGELIGERRMARRVVNRMYGPLLRMTHAS